MSLCVRVIVPQEYDQFCVTDVDSKIELVPKETQCFQFAFLPLAGHTWQTLEVRARQQALGSSWL